MAGRSRQAVSSVAAGRPVRRRPGQAWGRGRPPLTPGRGSGRGRAGPADPPPVPGAAGDATVAVSLAGTLFFTLPTEQARPQVAEFLLLTMAPFARRALMGRSSTGSGTAGAGRSAHAGPARVPVLGAGRRAGSSLAVSRRRSGAWSPPRRSWSPRRRPSPACCRGLTLVNADSRISMAEVAGAAVGGGGRGRRSPSSARSGRCGSVSPSSSRATVLAILLSPKVDSTEGERDFGGVLAAARRRPPSPGRTGPSDASGA